MPQPYILLVEDNEDHAALVLRAITKLGVAERVVTVKDGEEAIQFLSSIGPYQDRDPTDLPLFMVLDLKMPKKNGLQVLETIRSQSHTRVLPIVMFTTSIEQTDIITSYALGANSYVQKPIKFEVFTEVVQDLYRYWRERNQVINQAIR